MARGVWIVLAGLAWLSARAAVAAQPTELLAAGELEQQWLDGAARGGLVVGNGLLLAPGQYRVSVAAGLAYGAGGRSTQGLVAERLSAQVLGAVGVTRWLELSANVPIVLGQSTLVDVAVSSAGAGTPLVSGTFSLVGDDKPVAVSGTLGLGFPVGSRGVPGSGGLLVLPRLSVGRVFEQVQLGFELAGVVRRAVDLAELERGFDAVVASHVSFAALLASVADEGPRGEVSVRVLAPLARVRAGLETLVGLRWPLGDFELYGALGPGFSGDASVPRLRVYVGVATSDAALVRWPCVEGRPYELARCPRLDLDGDGVPNGVDRAPREPEDRDGFEDDDGIADLDNDGDGLLDGGDRCPGAPGPAANGGCPDVDADGDGLVDRLDACPTVPEDLDGDEDDDGCPEPSAPPAAAATP